MYTLCSINIYGLSIHSITATVSIGLYSRGEEFEFVKNLNSRDKKYRSARGMLCLRDGEVYYAETGKARLRYSDVNGSADKIVVPAEFYRAIVRVCPDEKQRAFIRADV